MVQLLQSNKKAKKQHIVEKFQKKMDKSFLINNHEEIFITCGKHFIYGQGFIAFIKEKNLNLLK
jgi:hypothetical protein